MRASDRTIVGKFGQPLSGLIGTMLLLAVAVVGLHAASGAFSDDYTLYANVDRAGFGVNTKSTVKVRGITVGNVRNVRLIDDNQVQLELDIRKGTEIPETTIASVEPLSLFGPKFVNLKLGEGEGVGPYLSDGDVITETETLTEVMESLEQISKLIDAIDEHDLSLILTEFGRGFDGLGETFGELLDNSSFIADRALANQARIDALLADAREITAAFEHRGGDFADTLHNTAGVLDAIVGAEDPLADLLVGASRLSTHLSDVIRAGSDDLSKIIEVLDPVTALLYSQLSQIPELLGMTEDIFNFLGETLLQWDMPDGRKGAVVSGYLRIDPCFLLQAC